MVTQLKSFMGSVFGSFGPSNEITSVCTELSKRYLSRQRVFNDWYSLLKLDDTLKQQDMESFVGNDPRTTWNMAVYLLTPRPILHQIISTEGRILSPAAQEAAQFIQQYFSRLWLSIDHSTIHQGQPSWLRSFVGLLVITGWYSVPYLVKSNGDGWVDYWNPATTFPEFDSDMGLVKLARIRKLSASEARATLQREGWMANYHASLNHSITEYQLWVDDGTSVSHGVSYDSSIVKPMSQVLGVDKIPILVGYVGGLPDDGSVDEMRSKSMGQSILAPNESIYLNYNKQQTFMQQLARDVANPRVFEKSSGNRPIIANVADWYKRGAFFRGGVNDEIQVIQPPGAPIELTQLLYTLRNSLQRGGFNDIVFANIAQETPVAMVSQAAESAMQLIEPYYTAIKTVISTVTDFWYQTYLKDARLRPSSWEGIDFTLLEDTRITSSYIIKIPGDLRNRIQQARELNPRFEIPLVKVYELMLPEISNPVEAVAQLDAERARLHPAYQQVQLVNAFDAAAAEARRFNNDQMAKLFEAVAAGMRRQLGQPNLPQDKLPNTAANNTNSAPTQSMSQLRM